MKDITESDSMNSKYLHSMSDVFELQGVVDPLH